METPMPTGNTMESLMLKSTKKQIAMGTATLMMRWWMKKPIRMGMHMVMQTTMQIPLRKVMESLMVWSMKKLIRMRMHMVMQVPM